MYIVSNLTLSFPKSVLGLANLIVAELTDPQHVRINGADNFFSLAKWIKLSFKSSPGFKRMEYVVNDDILKRNEIIFIFIAGS